MFEHIGIDPDAEAGRRRVIASAWATLGVGAVVGFALGVAAMAVAEPRVAAPLDELMVELDAPVEAEPPGPPQLPPGPPPGGSHRGEDAAPPPAPDEAPDEPAPLDAPVPDRVVDSGPTGTGLVPGTGAPTGGPPGGGGGGGGGGGEGGPRTFHASDLTARRKVEPRYPDAARALALGEQRCLARVEIDPEGVPVDVTVQNCPAVFHDETERALRAWRWYPVRLEGRKIGAVTTIAVVYRVD